MQIKIIASGSSGNCYKISDEQTTLMIEAGINLRQCNEGFDNDLSKVNGCLVTHEHKDHAGFVSQFTKRGIDFYMTHGTRTAINAQNNKKIKEIEAKKMFQIGSFRIKPFETQHDASEPVGFLIDSIATKERLVFATDTHYIKYYFNDVNYFMIECNYSYDILWNNINRGRTHPGRKKRLLESHFELENVKAFFKANDLTKIKRIYLIHISCENGDAFSFRDEIQKMTGLPVYI